MAVAAGCSNVKRDLAGFVVRSLRLQKAYRGVVLEQQQIEHAKIACARLVGHFLDHGLISEDLARCGLDGEMQNRVTVPVLRTDVETFVESLLQRQTVGRNDRPPSLEADRRQTCAQRPFWPPRMAQHHSLRRCLGQHPRRGGTSPCRTSEVYLLLPHSQRGDAELILGVYVCTCVDEHQGNLKVSPDCGDVKSGSAKSGFLLTAPANFEELFHDVHIIALSARRTKPHHLVCHRADGKGAKTTRGESYAFLRAERALGADDLQKLQCGVTKECPHFRSHREVL